MKNRTPFLLCLIGGLILLAANYTGGVTTIVVIFLFIHSFPVLAPIYFFVNILLFILFIIAWSGGFAVIIGGYLLTIKHVRLGKFIIAIAAGFGLISLILTIIYVVIQFGWVGLLILSWLILNTAWALGLILTIIARNRAK